MEISLLRALLNNISSFLLSSYNNCSDLNQKYYQKAEEVLKMLKPILDAISDAEVTSEEELNKTFLELSQSVDELRELFQFWKPLSSKTNFVFQNESLLSKIQTSAQDCFLLLKSSGQDVPDGLSSSSLEYCLEKLKHMGYGHASSVIKDAMRDQLDGIGPSSETLVKIADLLSLKSNQEILIEAVALEKLKENAEQAEKAGEADFIDQMISIVTRMHDRLVLIKQSETSRPVPIPPDLCCPLSLELMADPVIVASGQTYERAFIKNWIDLGLTVCPKTRQTLSHTCMIPNFTVKALIANWCETNNINLPDPKKILNQASPLLVHSESGSPNVFPHSWSNQQMSTELRSTSSAGKNMIMSNGVRREGSTLHPRSTSEVPTSGVVANGSDFGRISVVRSGERPLNSENISADSVVHHSAPLSRIDVDGSIVTRMHDRLVLIKQSDTSSPVPIPPDFCCPLSLKLMTDPVIVASGQTYERAFIKNWIDLGLTVCPKTRQTLSHTCMIPNFTLKALIANWCETNNINLPDPKKILNQASPLLVHSESGSPNVFPHSWSNQQMSTELRSTSSAGKNMIMSNGVRREGSTLHPRSTSEVPTSGVVANGSDFGRISVVRSGERPLNSENISADSVVHHSAPLSRIDVDGSIVTRMHDRLVLIKQSDTSSPVPIPPDFCCPLSLKLMTDPVIVASGQTYERAFIKNWIDLGLTVCPKTRQTLSHTCMIPNFTLKALIANWYETNNV